MSAARWVIIVGFVLGCAPRTALEHYEQKRLVVATVETARLDRAASNITYETLVHGSTQPAMVPRVRRRQGLERGAELSVIARTHNADLRERLGLLSDPCTSQRDVLLRREVWKASTMPVFADPMYADYRNTTDRSDTEPYLQNVAQVSVRMTSCTENDQLERWSSTWKPQSAP